MSLRAPVKSRASQKRSVEMDPVAAEVATKWLFIQLEPRFLADSRSKHVEACTASMNLEECRYIIHVYIYMYI